MSMVPPADMAKGPSRARAFVALALALFAVGSLALGVAAHSRPVMIDLKVALPGPPGGPAAAGFAPLYQTLTITETEPQIVREITYGGLTRLPSGDIKRTYVGKPPSLCPT
jgi:hypothetical protein